MSKTIIREFLVKKDIFQHKFDIKTDAVTLEYKNNILLTYDHSGNIYLANTRIKLGGTRLNSDNFWCYDSNFDTIGITSKHSLINVEGLLDFEVELSKLYLSGGLR